MLLLDEEVSPNWIGFCMPVVDTVQDETFGVHKHAKRRYVSVPHHTSQGCLCRGAATSDKEEGCQRAMAVNTDSLL
ncbi:hypothetical protein Deipe_1647 [Deinococcus peraridilitoris DSM 19664]|uniref:Uncharacterized protein n=1 Tax=Deinococcus peraridilitoris (strain DSM 19664 / LMG 22246 / CIP 109416 / KR-200) TaxID=937777 RepID=L0A2F5_DEIPD|nr:hypothetical protein Deipe_1647 [Deinococcus peraridilitoris DSM 19664]